jgi:hypothetical protein
MSETLGGLATTAAVVYGYLEFRSWKQRARSTDRASVAATLLAAFNPFCLAVQGSINELVLAAHRAEGLPGPRAREAFAPAQHGLRAVAAWHQELESAQFAAEAHLTPQELAPVVAAVTLRHEVEHEFEKLVVRVNKGETHGVFASANKVLPRLHQRVSSVREGGATLLRQIARHEAPIPGACAGEVHAGE